MKVKNVLGIMAFSMGVSLSMLHGAQAAELPADREVVTISARQAVNDEAVLALLWMQRSAEYQACCYQAYNALQETIMRAGESKGRRPQAIIIDIDETVLDNMPFKARTVGTEIGKARGAFSKWVAKEKAEALPGAVKALQLAKKKDIEVFFVSSRSAEKDLAATIHNLQRLGVPYADSAHLYLYQGKSEKGIRFREIEQRYEVVAYVGDNLLDFPLQADKAGEAERNLLVAKNCWQFGRRFIILPNPDYGSWENVLAENYEKLSPEQMLAVRRAALTVDR